jgi:hypothetical protein
MSRTGALWYVQKRPERVVARREGNRAQRRAWARQQGSQPVQEAKESPR